MEPVFKNLPSKDYDYIMYQLKQLQIAKGNVSKCDQCKNKMRFVKKLIDEKPEKAHLTTLMMYKDCVLSTTPYMYCTIGNFFVTTKAYTDKNLTKNLNLVSMVTKLSTFLTMISWIFGKIQHLG